MSCNDPRPFSRIDVAPPITINALSASCAFFMAVMVFVSPGPAVTTATPGIPVNLELASAANTALTSCRTSITAIPSLLHPTSIGAFFFIFFF